VDQGFLVAIIRVAILTWDWGVGGAGDRICCYPSLLRKGGI
jgi:hypothetical protein